MSTDGYGRVGMPRGVLGAPRWTGTSAVTPPHRAEVSGPRVADSGVRAKPSGARVLIVEPVAVLRTILTRAFAQRGHSVAAVGTASELRRLLPTFDPHVVICELSLPDGLGDVVCKRLKEGANRLLPVVLMSGLPEAELNRRAIQAGVDRSHCKARGLSELIDRVEELTSEIVF